MTYDLTVIGCGGIGSAVLYRAAQQGARVLGIEQFAPVHDRGSSHGHTRIIRQAYFEHPHYVPLLLEAYDLWAELEQTVGEQLYVQTGLLQAGPCDGEVVPGVLRSAEQHSLAIDRLDARQAMQRFPMFRIPEEHIAAFEYRAGYLFVEACVAAHLKAAEAAGASLMTQTKVLSYRDDAGDLVLTTTSGEIRTRRLAITAGAWLPDWMKGYEVPLTVLRKHLHWVESSDHRVQQSQGCPLFFFENAGGCYYGFPAIDDRWGLKVAEHSGGEPVADPASFDRQLDPIDHARIETFLQSYFHGQHRFQRHDVCMYTMTRDHHFLIDQHPQDERIWIAGGFSGHGFKFASVLGKLVAQAALGAAVDPRLQFLSLRRP